MGNNRHTEEAPRRHVSPCTFQVDCALIDDRLRFASLCLFSGRYAYVVCVDWTTSIARPENSVR